MCTSPVVTCFGSTVGSHRPLGFPLSRERVQQLADFYFPPPQAQLFYQAAGRSGGYCQLEREARWPGHDQPPGDCPRRFLKSRLGAWRHVCDHKGEGSLEGSPATRLSNWRHTDLNY